MIDTIHTTKPAKRVRRMAREPKSLEAHGDATATTATATKSASKANLVLNLLKRPEGATIPQLVVATGWLPHTTRAALTGLKKKGHAVTSSRATDEDRVYRVVAG
jgi:Protein of unknown function (DUF3489)